MFKQNKYFPKRLNGTNLKFSQYYQKVVVNLEL